MTHKGTVTIETPHLILRAFRHADAPAMFRNWANDPEVTKYLTWKPHTDVSLTQQVVDRWASSYKDPEFYQWAIVLKEIDEPIGSISVVGMHEIIIHTGTEAITLKHEAEDRALFAEGALKAARFLAGRDAGLYGMKEMLG